VEEATSAVVSVTFRRSRLAPLVTEVYISLVSHESLTERGQVSGADTRISNHSVVPPERTGLDPAVERVLQLRGEVIGIDRRSQDSLGRLPVIKGADEIQASSLLSGEDHRAGQRAVEHLTRF